MRLNKLPEDTNYVPTDFYRQMLSVLSQTWHTPQVTEMCTAHTHTHDTDSRRLCGERNEWMLWARDRRDKIPTSRSSSAPENCVNLCVVSSLDRSQLN